MPNIEHEKYWLLGVLVYVKSFNPLPWGIANVPNPVCVEVIRPERGREFEPKLIHDSHP